MTPVLLLLAGLVILVAGAEMLVRGATRLAIAMGVSPLVIGLTVVAYGTSAPEFAVSAFAAARDQSGIALGNVIGSNIFNILLVLGLSAVIAPLRVSAQLVRFDIPLMILVSVLLLLLALDGSIGRVEGMLLATGALAYTTYLIVQGRRDLKGADLPPPLPGHRPWWFSVGLVLGGLGLLVLGAGWLVDGAIVIARWAGLSELVIGLTIVAAGTSLPELATSLLAILRGERDIAVGNIIGSNIFNILAILGVAGMIETIEVSSAVLRFDLPIMLIVALSTLPVFFTGSVIGRGEGLLFLLGYVAYVAYLILASTQHDALPAFSRLVVQVALPLVVLTLGLSWWRQRHRERE